MTGHVPIIGGLVLSLQTILWEVILVLYLPRLFCKRWFDYSFHTFCDHYKNRDRFVGGGLTAIPTKIVLWVVSHFTSEIVLWEVVSHFTSDIVLQKVV